MFIHYMFIHLFKTTIAIIDDTCKNRPFNLYNSHRKVYKNYMFMFMFVITCPLLC